jgi:hypothetical protein
MKAPWLRAIWATPLVLAAASAACGSSGSGSTNPLTSGSGAGSGSTSGAGAGTGVTTGSNGTGGQVVGESVAFVVSKLYLGDTDAGGNEDPQNGWRSWGFNLDQRDSTPASVDLCKPHSGGTAQEVYPDGDNGIDNSFGKNVLPILAGIDGSYPAKVNASIAEGKSAAAIFELTNLGSGSDQGSLLGRFYRGVPLNKAPHFDGTDVWPVTKDSLSNPGDASSAKITFSDGALSGDGWFAHAEGGDLRIDLTVNGTSITLTILVPVVSLLLDPSHQSGHGIIAGVLDANAFAEQFRTLAGGFDPSLCSGPTIDSILGQIKGTADILTNGNQDHASTCNGISIGLGFDAAVVKLGAPVATPTPTDPCKGPP